MHHSEPPLSHTPVLHAEEGSSSPVLEILRPKLAEILLDVTLGLGGHAEAFLERIGPSGRLIGIDADLENLSQSRARLKRFEGQTELIHANFRSIEDLKLPVVDILFADLGLCSPHLDDPERGFTFRTEAPLDMRFDRSRGRTAEKVLAREDEDGLQEIFWNLGEIKESRHLAHAIVSSRKRGVTFQKTSDLRAVVERTFGYRAIALLPQVFQAIRMHVNDEIGSLQELLSVGPTRLKVGGRFGVISYHSLEDRLVKRAFAELSQPMKDARTGAVTEEAAYTLLTKKPIRPSEEEIERNPRARSARFRVITRLRAE